MQKIWFRKGEGAWYLTVREKGKQRQVKLLKAPNDRDGRKQAEQVAIQELAARPVDDVPEHSWITVEHVLKGFLKHSEENHEPETHKWYKGFFDTFLPKTGKLKISQLKKQHVMAWVKERGFSPTSANRGIGAIKRAFAWAVEEEHIRQSPIAHLRKPQAASRDRILSPDERQLILSSISDDAFRQYLQILALTGCRPGEAAKVTAEDVNLEHGLWVLKKHKTVKKTRKPRVIYLCPEALELTKKLMAEHPEGPLFLNTKGRKWTISAVRLRFTRLKRRFPQLKGIVAYSYRHTYCTDALEKGLPEAAVAELVGHKGTRTLHAHYAHLSQKVQFLRDAATKASPSEGAVPPDTAA